MGAERMVLSADATYSSIEKYRSTLSMHLRKQVLKPMVRVTSTGYFVDVIGPLASDGGNNYSGIFSSLKNHFTELVQSSDIWFYRPLKNQRAKKVKPSWKEITVSKILVWFGLFFAASQVSARSVEQLFSNSANNSIIPASNFSRFMSMLTIL